MINPQSLEHAIAKIGQPVQLRFVSLDAGLAVDPDLHAHCSDRMR